jgi:hypothetical protein
LPTEGKRSERLTLIKCLELYSTVFYPFKVLSPLLNCILIVWDAEDVPMEVTMKDKNILYAGLFCSLLSCRSVGGPITLSEFSNKNSDFLVQVEFVVFADEIKAHPTVFEKFQEAAAHWASVLPIHVETFVDDPSGPFWFMSPNYNAIEVHITDIQAAEYGASPYAIGLWDPDHNRLLLDADSLETNSAYIMSTALHEMGHMFGLPHFINKTDKARPGYILVDGAEKYVMYPMIVLSEKQEQLSELEIDLASHYVKYVFTNPVRSKADKECALNLVDTRR